MNKKIKRIDFEEFREHFPLYEASVLEYELMWKINEIIEILNNLPTNKGKEE